MIIAATSLAAQVKCLNAKIRMLFCLYNLWQSARIIYKTRDHGTVLSHKR